jgi:hypothetical protein
LQNEEQEAPQEVKKPEPLPHGVQKRIDRAVRQKYEAEAEAKVLRERISQIENSHRSQPRQQEAGEPKLDQFDNIEDYVAAKAGWVADKRINETLTAREKAQAEKNAQAAQSKTAETWNKRVMTAQNEMSDYDDVVGSSDIDFKEPAVIDAIRESEIGPKIAYYLASNPEIADEIAEMRGLAAIRAIGRIEAKLEGVQSNATKAPAPISTVGQKASITKSPEKMTDAEFAAWRKAQIAKRN